MATFQITREEFITKTLNRPALVKTLTNPDDATLIAIIRENSIAFDYLTEAQKTNTVCDFWITNYLKQTNHWNNVGTLPQAYLDTMADVTKLKLIEARTENVYYLNCSLPIWIETAKNSSFHMRDNIPAHVKASDDFVVAYLSAQTYGARAQNFDESRWNTSLVYRAVQVSPGTINHLPPHFITRSIVDEAVKAGLKQTQSLELGGLLPLSVWNENQAQLAEDLVTIEQDNIKYIPEQYRSSKVCIIATHSNEKALKYVPKALLTTEMLLLVLPDQAGIHRASTKILEFYPKRLLNDPEFLFAAAQIGVSDTQRFSIPTALNTLIATFRIQPSHTTWLKLLQNCPQAIKLVEKTNQTSEMIDCLIQHATPEALSNVAPWLNRTKITKDKVVLLIGIKGYEDLVERKLKGPAPRKPTEAGAASVQPDPGVPCVTLEMSPGLFAKTFPKLK